MLGSVWAAEDRSAAEAQFEQEQEIENRLFLAGYQRFVKEMRAVAILEACDKSGLAKSIGTSVDAKFEFLARETMRKEAWSDTSLAFLQGLTSQEVTSISEKATDCLRGYQFGVMDTVRIVKDQLPALCDVGVKLADDLLKERSPK